MGSLNPENETKGELDDSGYVQEDSAVKTQPVEEMDQVVHLLDLSDDVLLYILQYCEPLDLKALGYTCPRLGALVLDRTLWQRVDARGAPTGAGRLRWLLAHALAEHTAALRLAGHAREVEGCLGYMNGTPEGPLIQTHSDPWVRVEPYGTRLLRLCAQALPRDEAGFPYMSMEHSPEVIDDQEKETDKDKPACPGPQITMSHSALYRLVAQCPNLTELALEHVVIDCNMTKISMFPPTLRVLSLLGSKCFNLGKSYLYKIQDHLVHLENLNLSECDWVEPACMLPLSKLPRLSRLIMRLCPKLTEFVAYASLATRYGFKQLKVLDLRGSPVGDSEVSALGWVPLLEELYLSPAPRAPRPRTHAHLACAAPRDTAGWERDEPEYYTRKYESEAWLKGEKKARRKKRADNQIFDPSNTSRGEERMTKERAARLRYLFEDNDEGSSNYNDSGSYLPSQGTSARNDTHNGDKDAKKRKYDDDSDSSDDSSPNEAILIKGPINNSTDDTTNDAKDDLSKPGTSGQSDKNDSKDKKDARKRRHGYDSDSDSNGAAPVRMATSLFERVIPPNLSDAAKEVCLEAPGHRNYMANPTSMECQPSTSTSQPSMLESQPSTSASQPSTMESQPSTSASQPSMMESQPSTSETEPSTSSSQPSTSKKPGSLDHKSKDTLKELLNSMDKLIRDAPIKRQRYLAARNYQMSRAILLDSLQEYKLMQNRSNNSESDDNNEESSDSDDEPETKKSKPDNGASTSKAQDAKTANANRKNKSPKKEEASSPLDATLQFNEALYKIFTRIKDHAMRQSSLSNMYERQFCNINKKIRQRQLAQQQRASRNEQRQEQQQPEQQQPEQQQQEPQRFVRFRLNEPPVYVETTTTTTVYRKKKNEEEGSSKEEREAPPVDNEENPRPVVVESSSQSYFVVDGSSQHSAEEATVDKESGSQPSVAAEDGSKPSVAQGNGSQTFVAVEIGSQPSVAEGSGSQPSVATQPVIAMEVDNRPLVIQANPNMENDNRPLVIEGHPPLDNMIDQLSAGGHRPMLISGNNAAINMDLDNRPIVFEGRPFMEGDRPIVIECNPMNVVRDRPMDINPDNMEGDRPVVMEGDDNRPMAMEGNASYQMRLDDDEFRQQHYARFNAFNNNDAREPDWNFRPMEGSSNTQGNDPQPSNSAPPRHRILYVNVGRRRHATYQLTMPQTSQENLTAAMNLIYSSHAPVRLDHASLVTDAAIRRFGRAENENISYVQLGPRGPIPAPHEDPHARPNRSNLRILSVTGFRHITNVSLEHLATAAPRLQFLDLTGTRVTENAVEHFKHFRPDCEVKFGPNGNNPDGSNAPS